MEAELKKFQIETVNYIMEGISTSNNKFNRFLIADEVGLGKTMIARGIIEKYKEKYGQKPFNVYYLCSNQTLSSQNIDTLSKIDHKSQLCQISSRVTNLIENNKNIDKIIGLTPGTSFNLRNYLGNKTERCWIYYVLFYNFRTKIYQFFGERKLHKYFQGQAGYYGWFKQLLSTKGDNTYSLENDGYLKGLNKYNRAELPKCKRLKKLFHHLKPNKELCKQLKQFKFNLEIENEIIENLEEIKYSLFNTNESEANEKIKELFILVRKFIAKTIFSSCKDLKPSMIILDEFQNFQEIIRFSDYDGSEKQGLAKVSEEIKKYFFEANTKEKVPIIVLSATPYKMVTVNGEKEDHYKDFMDTIGWLMNRPNCNDLNKLKNAQSEFHNIIEKIPAKQKLTKSEREKIKVRLIENKKIRESILKPYVVRTERKNRLETNGISESDFKKRVISLGQAKSLINQFKVINNILQNHTKPEILNYWQDGEYWLSFMNKEDYKFSKKFIDEGLPNISRHNLKLLKKEKFFLDEKVLEKDIQVNNTKLKFLTNTIEESKQNILLWRLPLKKTYELSKKEFFSKDNEKMLIFSSNIYIPKMISVIISHNYDYFNGINFGKKGKKINLVNYKSKSNDNPKKEKGYANKYLLNILYPSYFLSSLVIKRRTNLQKVLSDLETQIKQKLVGLGIKIDKDKRFDNVLPIILDDFLLKDKGFKGGLSKEFDDIIEKLKSKKEKEKKHHSEEIQHFILELKNSLEKYKLEEMVISKKSIKKLAELTLFSPSNCILRNILKYESTGMKDINQKLFRETIQFSLKTIKNYFSKKYVSILISKFSKVKRFREKKYWKEIMAYCKYAYFNDVIEEYFCLLKDRPSDTSFLDELEDVLSISSGAVTIHGIIDGKYEPLEKRIITNYAIAYSEQEMIPNDDKTGNKLRTTSIKNAFNSPFFPFIVATTSKGQEGLDFHKYCDRIIHWNISPNPIELEQREGRLDRYKSYAIRKALSKKTKYLDWEKSWEKYGDESQMEPYWSLKSAKIKRTVLAYPLSKDAESYELAKENSMYYRFALGQPKQQNIINKIKRLFHNKKELKKGLKDLSINLSPLEKRKKKV